MVWVVVIHDGAQREEALGKNDVDPLSLAIPTVGSWSQQVFFNLMIVTVPSVHDESGRIVKHAFRDKLSKL